MQLRHYIFSLFFYLSLNCGSKNLPNLTSIKNSKERNLSQFQPLTKDTAQSFRMEILFDDTLPNCIKPCDQSQNQKKIDHLKNTLQLVKNYFQSFLLVNRMTSENRFSLKDICHNVASPFYLQEFSIDADFVLITKTFYDPDKQMIASVQPCQLDPVTFRPINGFTQINLYHYEYQQASQHSMITTMLHEVTHALFFKDYLYSNFIDPFTGQKKLDVIQTIDNVTYVTSQEVKAYAQKFYKCEDLIGVPLEQDQGGQSDGEHWEKKLLFDEYMTPNVAKANYVSHLTAAFFRDSGWYLTNDAIAQPVQNGRHLGCQLLNDYKNCSSEQFPDMYCNPKSFDKTICDSQGFCGSSCDPFLLRFDNTCYRVNHYSFCADDQKSYAQEEFIIMSGWNFTEQSRCFKGEIFNSDGFAMQHPQYNYPAFCHEKGITFTVDKTNFTCDKEEENIFVKTIDGFSGKIKCPSDFRTFCQNEKPNHGCLGNCQSQGFCGAPNTCVCSTSDSNGNYVRSQCVEQEKILFFQNKGQQIISYFVFITLLNYFV